MTDEYKPYHALAGESSVRIRVAGCWAHCKKRFAEAVKTSPSSVKGSVAWEANGRIAAIYHVDNMTTGEEPKERKRHRGTVVKLLVDSFFTWASETVNQMGTKKTQEALRYTLNQEPYLREFLTDGRIPLDNSDAERSSRTFCVGKHNWHVVETKRGAKAGGILYIMTGTAKANGLKEICAGRHVGIRGVDHGEIPENDRTLVDQPAGTVKGKTDRK